MLRGTFTNIKCVRDTSRRIISEIHFGRNPCCASSCPPEQKNQSVGMTKIETSAMSASSRVKMPRFDPNGRTEEKICVCGELVWSEVLDVGSGLSSSRFDNCCSILGDCSWPHKNSKLFFTYSTERCKESFPFFSNLQLGI
jgi:hypothetical protein